jgi:hypothetical protein
MKCVQSSSTDSSSSSAVNPFVLPNPSDLLSLDGVDPWLTPAFESALTAAFHSLDADHDNYLNQQELNSWCRKCNGRDFTATEMEELRENFFQSQEDQKSDQEANGANGNEQIGLRLEGFHNFYFLQTSSEPRESVKDLEKLGWIWSKKEKIFVKKN